MQQSTKGYYQWQFSRYLILNFLERVLRWSRNSDLMLHNIWLTPTFSGDGAVFAAMAAETNTIKTGIRYSTSQETVQLYSSGC